MRSPKPAVVLACIAMLAVACGEALGQHAEAPVEAAGPTGTLKGTMLGPSAGSPGPVMLIIPGSGPTDRDGNQPPRLRAAPYRLLAEGLAERGIVTVRIDKRGMFASAAAAADANNVTIAGFADDAKAWTAMLRRRTGAPCIWIAGHSEGALVALVAAQSDPNACGLVLIAAPGRRISEVLREQITSSPALAPMRDDALTVIAELEAGRRVKVDALHPTLQQLFYPGVQDFLISLYSYDPVALLGAYPGPVLVLHGTHDLQVSQDDATALRTARSGVAYVGLPGVNHVLKAVPANDRQANIAAYADPDLPLAPGVVDAIADFVRAQPPD